MWALTLFPVRSVLARGKSSPNWEGTLAFDTVKLPPQYETWLIMHVQ